MRRDSRGIPMSKNATLIIGVVNLLLAIILPFDYVNLINLGVGILLIWQWNNME